MNNQEWRAGEAQFLTLHLSCVGEERWVTLPESVTDSLSEFRYLLYLVLSVPDSFIFERKGEALHYVSSGDLGQPWRDDVGRLIERHFKGVLLYFMPEGKWRLGIRSRENGA